MDRRAFLKNGITVTVATTVGGLVWPAGASAAEGAGWRTFEVVMHAEVLNPSGPSRVWLPMPLTPDTDYHRNRGHSWTGNPWRRPAV
jgi:hypothetical protein